jgi:hypothetical protein
MILNYSLTTGGFSGTSVGLILQHRPFGAQQIWPLQLDAVSGKYGWMDGLV